MRNRRWIEALALLALLLSLTGCGGGHDAAQAAGESGTQAAPGPAEALIEREAAEGGLSIPLEELSAEPKLIDWKQDGVAMQLIALVDDENRICLAYNTCQSCAGSPYAYFAYEDGTLICQNCGNRFGLDTVGTVAGGCNPMPVGEASIENGSVVIPASELRAAASAFANWKKFS